MLNSMTKDQQKELRMIKRTVQLLVDQAKNLTLKLDVLKSNNKLKKLLLITIKKNYKKD